MRASFWSLLLKPKQHRQAESQDGPASCHWRARLLQIKVGPARPANGLVGPAGRASMLQKQAARSSIGRPGPPALRPVQAIACYGLRLYGMARVATSQGRQKLSTAKRQAYPTVGPAAGIK